MSDYDSLADEGSDVYYDRSGDEYYSSEESTDVEEEILSPLKELETLCKSDNLSIAALREKINLIPKALQGRQIIKAYSKHPFFHRACMNKNVTLEVVRFILDVCPDAMKRGVVLRTNSAYPLHCCCLSGDCPDSVIKHILDGYPEAIRYACLIQNGPRHGYGYDYCFEGIPLKYYLARSKHVNLDTIKMLVEAYPDSLSYSYNRLHIVPIHILLSNGNISNLQEIATYLLDSEPESIRLLDRTDGTLLHLACGNKKVDLALVTLLYDAWPEAMRLRNNNRSGGRLPIHQLCRNSKLDENASLDILRFMLDVDPNFPMERDSGGDLPIHRACIEMSTEFCKELITAYLKEENDSGDLPILSLLFYEVPFFVEPQVHFLRVHVGHFEVPFLN